MVYKWSGIHPGNAGNAQAIGEELAALMAAGKGTPPEIVRRARRKNSAMHNCFDWNDKTAAQAYREHQARMVVCSIVQVVERRNEPPLEIRAFVNVGREYNKPGRYIMTQVAMSEPDTAAEVLARAYAALQAWRAHYGTLKAFADIVAAIDAVPATE